MKIVVFLVLFVFQTASAQTDSTRRVEQNYQGDYGVQVAQNLGEIHIEGGTVQIGINNGKVYIAYVGNPKDKVKIKDYEVKIANLTAQIEKYLETIKRQEKRSLSDREKLIKADEYAKGLINQIDQLNKRIAMLDEQHELTKKIKDARDKFDVPLVKQLLKEKQLIDDRTSAETAFQLAGFQALDLEYMEAYVNYKKAVLLDTNNSLYLNATGLMANTLGKHREAIKLFKLALASDLKNYGQDHPQVAADCNNLGVAWQALGEYRKAIEYYELALASDLKTFRQDHLNVARDRNNLGMAWKSLGEYRKAIEYYELTLASVLKTYGQDHPGVAICRNNLGMALLDSGEYRKAIEYFELALASNLKTYRQDHPKVATDRNNLGMALLDSGEYRKAIEYFELALASNLKTYGQDHPDVARDRSNLGLAWHTLGKYRKAIEYFELALASNLKTYRQDHPDVARDRNNLGMSWQNLGEYRKAIKYYELALATCNRMLGKDHHNTIKVLNNLNDAKVKMAQKNNK